MATQSHNPEHPQAPRSATGIGAPTRHELHDDAHARRQAGIVGTAAEATAAYEQAMHRPMMAGIADPHPDAAFVLGIDRKSTRLNSSPSCAARMPSSA